MLVALTWGAALVFVLVVAADTRIGPVVFRITEKHGVHLGDIYATLAAVVVALLITVWIVVDHMGKQRRYQRLVRRAARGPEPAWAEPEDEHDADADLVDTVLIEREPDDTGRHRPLQPPF